MSKAQSLGVVLTLGVILSASVALAADGAFTDDDGNIFEGAIASIAAKGITEGCNPPINDRFCPNDLLTRGEMAVFLVRAYGYADDGGGNLFADDDGFFYESAADRLKVAGVTQGCNPPLNDRFCGESPVTREQMAALLVRAGGMIIDGGGMAFIDDDDSLFEGAIDRLAYAGITQGCNPPDNDMFCPDDFVTRGQMAAFLSRALKTEYSRGEARAVIGGVEFLADGECQVQDDSHAFESNVYASESMTEPDIMLITSGMNGVASVDIPDGSVIFNLEDGTLSGTEPTFLVSASGFSVEGIFVDGLGLVTFVEGRIDVLCD